MVFDSLSKALYYKEQLGGRIQILNRWEIIRGETTHREDYDGLSVKARDENIKLDQDVYILTQKRKLNYQMVFVILKSLFIKYIMTI